MQAENAKHAAEMLKRSGELAGTAAEMLEGGAAGEAVTQQQLVAQKYKLLLGTSLAFGIVNFLGIVLLLYLNLMP